MRNTSRPTLLANALLATALLLTATGCSKSADPPTAPVARISIGTTIDDSVVTRKGEVQLSGFVDGQSQMDHAVMVALAVEGVSGISNEMSIKK